MQEIIILKEVALEVPIGLLSKWKSIYYISFHGRISRTPSANSINIPSHYVQPRHPHPQNEISRICGYACHQQWNEATRRRRRRYVCMLLKKRSIAVTASATFVTKTAIPGFHCNIWTLCSGILCVFGLGVRYSWEKLLAVNCTRRR